MIEVLVTVAIIAMISTGIAIAVLKIAEQQKVSLTRTNAEPLRGSVKIWWALGTEGETCPTTAMLLADGALDRSKFNKVDAWGQPWTIKCDEHDATVISWGPDKLPGTDDDIRVPPA